MDANYNNLFLAIIEQAIKDLHTKSFRNAAKAWINKYDEADITSFNNLCLYLGWDYDVAKHNIKNNKIKLSASGWVLNKLKFNNNNNKGDGYD